MNARKILLSTLLVAVVIGALVHRRISPPSQPKTNPDISSVSTNEPTPSFIQPKPSGPPGLPPGDELLVHYGSLQSTIEKDLTTIHHLLQGYQLLAKSSAPLPLGSNQEITAALTGKNRIRMSYVSSNNPAISPKQELVDRWKTPLFFHALASDKIEIRSAGPDRILGTDDDITRGANGLVRRGAQ